jgi:hypothetical protein
MKERPISFISDMVWAILFNRKTETRRIIKLPRWSTGDWKDFQLDDNRIPMVIAKNTGCLASIHCPYGEPGDRLWVKETWAEMCRLADPRCDCDEEAIKKNHFFEYRVDTGNPLPGEWPEEKRQDPDCPKWKSSRFMPRKASRIMLDIVKIRVERLLEISLDENVEDLFSEGLSKANYMEFADGESTDLNVVEALDDFNYLWNFLIAKRGYGGDVNPWVWVVEFKRLKAQE